MEDLQQLHGFTWPIILNGVKDASRLTTFYRKGIRKNDEPAQNMLLMKIMTVNWMGGVDWDLSFRYRT